MNEYSTRYTEAIDANQTTPADQWRKQATTNRQGSSGDFVVEWPKDDESPHDPATLSAGAYLSKREASLHAHARDVYEERLAFGVAKEQARKDLPLSTYTEVVWQMDLSNLMGFLSLRMDKHAQLEIRAYADVMGEQILAKVCPWTWEAFNDYNLRRNAVLLTALDVEAVQAVVKDLLANYHIATPQANHLDDYLANTPRLTDEWLPGKKSRERDECIVKLKRLGLLV